MIRRLQLKSFFILLAATIIVFITACSNNAPQVKDARISIIFDYEAMDKLPEARLGIFVEASSNPRRFGTVTVDAKGADFSWSVNDLIIAQNHEQKFCGAVNLVMPKNEQFPMGEYKVQFIQEDEEKTEHKLTLSYDKSLYKLKADDAVQLMDSNRSERMLKVYNADNKVIYYGPRTSELNDSRSIWNHYREASEFQESWISSNGSVIVNLPVEKVSPDN